MKFSGKSLLAGALFLFCMMLPNFALADNTTDFSNSGGTLTGTSAGLTLTGSTLIAVNGYGNLGLVTEILELLPSPQALGQRIVADGRNVCGWRHIHYRRQRHRRPAQRRALFRIVLR